MFGLTAGALSTAGAVSSATTHATFIDMAPEGEVNQKLLLARRSALAPGWHASVRLEAPSSALSDDRDNLRDSSARPLCAPARGAAHAPHYCALLRAGQRGRLDRSTLWPPGRAPIQAGACGSAQVLVLEEKRRRRISPEPQWRDRVATSWGINGPLGSSRGPLGQRCLAQSATGAGRESWRLRV